MLNLTTVANQHTSQDTKLSRHTYQTTHTNQCEPNSADTPTKLSTRPMLNLTTVTDQHSSQGTKLGQHTYQTTRANRHELKRLLV